MYHLHNKNARGGVATYNLEQRKKEEYKMAQFELNIYGKDDEIVKTLKTDKVRWGVYLEAIKLDESGLKNKSYAEQFDLINGIIKKIFPDLTDEDLVNADGDDILNTFKQFLRKGNKLNVDSKNVQGVE